MESQVLYVVLSVITTLVLGLGTFYRFYISPALKHKSSIEKWRTGIEHQLDKMKTKQESFEREIIRVERLEKNLNDMNLTLARIEERIIGLSQGGRAKP